MLSSDCFYILICLVYIHSHKQSFTILSKCIYLKKLIKHFFLERYQVLFEEEKDHQRKKNEAQNSAEEEKEKMYQHYHERNRNQN